MTLMLNRGPFRRNCRTDSKQNRECSRIGKFLSWIKDEQGFDKIFHYQVTLRAANIGNALLLSTKQRGVQSKCAELQNIMPFRSSIRQHPKAKKYRQAKPLFTLNQEQNPSGTWWDQVRLNGFRQSHTLHTFHHCPAHCCSYRQSTQLEGRTIFFCC